MGKINVGGVNFDNITLIDTCKLIGTQINNYKNNACTSLVVCANIDIFNHINKYKNLTEKLLNSAFLTIPDGYSIILGSKFLGTPLNERIAGPDLMLKIISEASSNKFRHFFLGAQDGVAEKMCDRFKRDFPEIEIAGIYAPPFCEFSDDENAKIVRLVNEHSPDILWVSFGCPKQEWWGLKHQMLLKVPVTIGVGAAFDFHSGNIKRAPLFIQRVGFEWLFRVFQEPKRLSRRYVMGMYNFIKVLWRQQREDGF